MEIPDQKAYPSPPPPASPAQVPQANVQWGPHFSRIYPPTTTSQHNPTQSLHSSAPATFENRAAWNDCPGPPHLFQRSGHMCHRDEVFPDYTWQSLFCHLGWHVFSAPWEEGGLEVMLPVMMPYARPLSDSRKAWHSLRRHCLPSTIRYLTFTHKVALTELKWQLFLPLMLPVLKFLPHSMFSTFLLVKFISYANQHTPQ